MNPDATWIVTFSVESPFNKSGVHLLTDKLKRFALPRIHDGAAFSAIDFALEACRWSDCNFFEAEYELTEFAREHGTPLDTMVAFGVEMQRLVVGRADRLVHKLESLVYLTLSNSISLSDRICRATRELNRADSKIWTSQPVPDPDSDDDVPLKRWLAARYDKHRNSIGQGPVAVSLKSMVDWRNDRTHASHLFVFARGRREALEVVYSPSSMAAYIEDRGYFTSAELTRSIVDLQNFTEWWAADSVRQVEDLEK